jgi:hypothetical protein
MAHCRFENTYKDLSDCMDVLSDCGNLKEFIESLNQYEKPFVKRLIKLCAEISEFQEELT